MNAAQEDCAGLAPHAEFMTARQITVEPVPHDLSLITDVRFGWPPYGKSDAARFVDRTTLFSTSDRPATTFEFSSKRVEQTVDPIETAVFQRCTRDAASRTAL